VAPKNVVSPFFAPFVCPCPSAALCPAASLHSSHGLCQASGMESSLSRKRWPGRRRASQTCPPLIFLCFLFYILFWLFYDTGSCNTIHKVMEVLGWPECKQFRKRAGKGQNFLHDGQAETPPFRSRAATKCCGKSRQALLRTSG